LRCAILCCAFDGSADSTAIGRLRNDQSFAQQSVDCAVVDDDNGLLTEPNLGMNSVEHLPLVGMIGVTAPLEMFVKGLGLGLGFRVNDP